MMATIRTAVRVDSREMRLLTQDNRDWNAHLNRSICGAIHRNVIIMSCSASDPEATESQAYILHLDSIFHQHVNQI